MQHGTVFQLFEETSRSRASEPAYRFKRDGAWHDVTWGEARASALRIAKALMACGIGKGDRVGLLSQTRLEWVLCDFGTVACGGVTVGIYASNLGPDCAYIINHAEIPLLFVDTREQLDKIRGVRGDIPVLRQIVLFDGPSDPAAGVLSWDEFLAKGEAVTDEQLAERSRSVGPEDLASLVYTSGTTGRPKGAMISNDNLVFSSWSASQCMALESNFTTLLFLPLAHVFARLVVHFCMRVGVAIAFAESIPKVPQNLQETHPDFIASVPRTFEKIHETATVKAAEAGGLKKKIFDWAIDVGLRVSRLQQDKRPVPPGLALQRAIADRLVFSKIRAALGGRVRWAISGAAPLNPAIAEFFHACGILILEGIGMTENTSFSNVNRLDNNKFGTVGPPGPGVEVKIADDGEVLFRGPNVMQGYYKDPEATAEAIDGDGWLHSGDVGEIDEDGFLKITDRKKDLLVTAGGKNVAPQKIERIMRTSPFIGQIVAVGDKRKYVSALIALDPENIGKWCAERGIHCDGMAELAGNSEIQALIEQEIEERNRQLASYETIKRFRIVPDDFSINGGELTPTLKVRRKNVREKYGDLIEEMYRS